MKSPITKLKHQFEDIVKTHIHNKVSHNSCLELFLLEGDGKKVASMAKEFQKEDKMKSVEITRYLRNPVSHDIRNHRRRVQLECAVIYRRTWMLEPLKGPVFRKGSPYY